MNERDTLTHWLDKEVPETGQRYGYFTTMCGKEIETPNAAHKASGKLSEVTCTDCLKKHRDHSPNFRL